MSAVSSASFHSFDSDFARAISRKFEHGQFLIVGANPQKLESQFAEAEREADVWSHEELASKLSQDTGKARFACVLTQLRSELLMRPHVSFSFRFSKLGFQFLRVGSDDEKLAMLELPRDRAREIRIKRMER